MAWQTITSTVASEFSDLADLEQLTRTVLRLVLAALLGGCLGWQRERDGQEAGIRTHMLVAASSALFLLVPQQMGMGDDGTSRVLQGLLAGVGFICAGSILKVPEAQRVHGLTTAAGIWMTAAIGVAAGLGREMTAVFSTLLVLAIFLLEKPLNRMGARRPRP
ncbi:MgtC/SapB family protein [Ramlibacter sp. XY19]|uniref:MgtC/SapB family protein n=1 Tax=Ramlibacter paludis TaxID=2908000 RepID=UPI0023DBFC73|nr:MgtC/SapB family protein [Ramlibacter paludis]MCG2591363.1 MgtC/SapB family protein [Ramlibacter paludis]